MGILVIFHVQYWMVVAIVFRPFVISVASKQKTSCTLYTWYALDCKTKYKTPP